MHFDYDFAYNVLLPLSAAAYSLPLTKGVMPEGYEQVSPIHVDQTPNLKTAKLKELINRNQFGWVYLKERTLIVAYRGTDDFSDVVSDVDIHHEDYKCVSNYGSVHQGFQAVYVAIRDSVIDICKLCTGTYDRLILTGHSLGGALSELSAPDLYHQNLGNPEVINFAAPRVGKRDFARSFDADKLRCTRVVNRWDSIPKLPSLWTGYLHVGDAVTINGGFTLNSLHAHSLDNSYRPGIRNMLKNMLP